MNPDVVNNLLFELGIGPRESNGNRRYLKPWSPPWFATLCDYDNKYYIYHNRPGSNGNNYIKVHASSLDELDLKLLETLKAENNLKNTIEYINDPNDP